MKSVFSHCVIVLFFAGLICPSVFGENDKRSEADVSKIQRKRDAALDAIIKPISEIRIKYLEELEARRKEAQAEGDLDGVIAADEVIEDQAVETSFDPIYEDDKIEQIQKKYSRWYDEAMIKAEGQELQINRTYVQDLHP